jgi:hypothetical protein
MAFFVRVSSLILLLLSFLVYFLEPLYSRFLIVIPIFQLALLILLVSKNLPLVLFFIYCIIFYAYLFPRFILDLPVVYYFDYDNIAFYTKALMANILFWSTLCFFLKTTKNSYKFPDFSNFFKPNQWIVVLNIVIMFLIILFGFKGDNILSGAKYGTEDFGDKSIFTEYFIIFLIIAYVHCANQISKLLVLSIGALMVLVALIYASRVSALLCILTVFVLHFSNRFSLRKIFTISVIGLTFMNAISLIRAGSTNMSMVFSKNHNGIISSTQANMFYGSVTLIALTDEGKIDTPKRIKSLIGFIGRLFLPSSLSFKEGSLASFGQKLSPWGGGADPTAYFYVWFGWLGPIIFGLLIVFLMNGMSRPNVDKYFFFMGIILLATFPRWFGYEPGVIFKMTWVGIVILIVQENLFFKIRKWNQK